MSRLSQETLLAIISVQQEIVEADLSLEGVMNVVTHAAARLTTADAAVVELLEGESVVYRAGCGTAHAHVGLRLSPAGSISGLCMSLDTTLLSEDCETDERVDRAACRRVGARSMVVTPLRYRGDALGVLKIYSRRPHAFDEMSAETLKLLVGIVSASMHRAREHELLAKRAQCDVLTGLANRDEIVRAIGRRIAEQRPFALAFLDLNDFKRINDERGHAHGDVILQAVARRLVASLRTADIAARFGGDEFVVLLEGIDSTSATNAILDRLLARITDPIDDDGELLSVSASAGIAVFPSDAGTAESLLHIADTRMYAGKRMQREM